MYITNHDFGAYHISNNYKKMIYSIINIDKTPLFWPFQNKVD